MPRGMVSGSAWGTLAGAAGILIAMAAIDRRELTRPDVPMDLAERPDKAESAPEARTDDLPGVGERTALEQASADDAPVRPLGTLRPRAGAVPQISPSSSVAPQAADGRAPSESLRAGAPEMPIMDGAGAKAVDGGAVGGVAVMAALPDRDLSSPADLPEIATPWRAFVAARGPGAVTEPAAIDPSPLTPSGAAGWQDVVQPTLGGAKVVPGAVGGDTPTGRAAPVAWITPDHADRRGDTAEEPTPAQPDSLAAAPSRPGAITSVPGRPADRMVAPRPEGNAPGLGLREAEVGRPQHGTFASAPVNADQPAAGLDPGAAGAASAGSDQPDIVRGRPP